MSGRFDDRNAETRINDLEYRIRPEAKGSIRFLSECSQGLVIDSIHIVSRLDEPSLSSSPGLLGAMKAIRPPRLLSVLLGEQEEDRLFREPEQKHRHQTIRLRRVIPGT